MKTLKQFVELLPCLVKNEKCFGRIDAHHVKTRGAGGKDEGNLIPLCRAHHIYIHSVGILTFMKKFSVNLKEVAELIQKKYEGVYGR